MFRTLARVPLAFSEYSDEGTLKDRVPPVLMTHGLLGAKQNWNTIAKAVARLTKRKVSRSSRSVSIYDCASLDSTQFPSNV